MGLFKDIVKEAVSEMEFIQGRGAPPEAQVRFDVPSAERGSAPEDITDTHYGKFYGIDGVPLPKIEKARKGKKVGDYDTSKMGMLKSVTQPITHNEVPVGFIQDGGAKYLDVDPNYFDDGNGRRPFKRIDEVRQEFLDFAANYAPAPYVPGISGGINGQVMKPSADLIEAAYKSGCFRYWIPLADLKVVCGRGEESEMSTPTIGNGLEYILGLRQNSESDSDLVDSELKSYQINEGNFMGLFNLNPYNYKVYFDKRDPKTGKLIARDVTGRVLAGNSIDRFLSDLLKNRRIDTEKHSRELVSNGYRYYEGGKFASKSYARAIIQKGYDSPGNEEYDRFEIMTQFFVLPNQEDRPDNSKIKISTVDGYKKSEKTKKKLDEVRKTGESQYRDGDPVNRQQEITTMESELIPIERLAMRYEINASEAVGLFGRKREGGYTITKETLSQVLQKKIQSLIWVPSIKVDLEKQFKSRPWLWQYASYTNWRPIDNDGAAYRKFFTFLEPKKYVVEETSHLLFNFIECINKGYVIINFTIDKNLAMTASFQINKVDPKAAEALWRVRAENEANIQPAPEKYVWAEYDGEKEARIMSDKESVENSAETVSQFYPSLSSPEYENDLAQNRKENQLRQSVLRAPNIKKTKDPAI